MRQVEVVYKNLEIANYSYKSYNFSVQSIPDLSNKIKKYIAMKYELLIISLILSNYLSFSQRIWAADWSAILFSEILDEDRQPEIHLPESYNTSDKKYPVVELLDRNYNFIHTTRITKFLYLNWLVPEMVIVGVRNTNRNKYLTPGSL